jgi:hypothetical protein
MELYGDTFIWIVSVYDPGEAPLYVFAAIVPVIGTATAAPVPVPVRPLSKEIV